MYNCIKCGTQVADRLDFDNLNETLTCPDCGAYYTVCYDYCYDYCLGEEDQYELEDLGWFFLDFMGDYVIDPNTKVYE
jgi:hypothetical protein